MRAPFRGASWAPASRWTAARLCRARRRPAAQSERSLVTASTVAGPGTFGSHKWATPALVIPIATVSGLFALGSVVDAFVPDIRTAGHVAFGISAVLLAIVATRSIVAGFVVSDDRVRVRGIWATRTVERDDIAGFAFECDAAGRF